MSNPLSELIAEKGLLLADGAIGTNLFAMGLSGEAPELWNEDAPEKIARLHRDFVDAGADIILTNSFGGTRIRLKQHDAEHRLAGLNRKAAEIARSVADTAGRKVIVAGSVGPTAQLLAPLGPLKYDDAVAAFREQIEALKAGGADIIWIETMSAPDEMRAAAQGAIEAGMAYTVTGSFDMAGRTMMGMHPKDIHGVFAETPARPVAVGANCGVGAPDILATLLNMSSADSEATLIVKGNCGMPEKQGEDIVYSGTPELMAEYVHLAIDAGATIIGGCCGTSCEHLKAMRAALDTHQKGPRPTLDDVVSRVGPLRNKPAPEESPGARSLARARRRA